SATAAYGMGLDVGTYRGLPMISHTGSWGGYRSAFIRFPQQRVAVATFCNYAASGPDSLAKKVAAIYLAREMAVDRDSAFRVGLASSPRAEPPASLASFAGVWRNIDRGEVRRTVVVGDTLELAAPTPNGRRTPLVPLGGARFRQGSTAFVEFHGDSLVVRPGPALPIVYTRVAAADLTPAQLGEYAGTYYSPEVDVTWIVSVQNGSLVATRGG